MIRMNRPWCPIYHYHAPTNHICSNGCYQKEAKR